MFVAIYSTTIALYVVKFIKIVFGSLRSRIVAIIFLVACSLLEFAAYIVLMIFYIISLNAFVMIDDTLLNYAKDNACSDAVLQRALTVYADSY